MDITGIIAIICCTIIALAILYFGFELNKTNPYIFSEKDLKEFIEKNYIIYPKEKEEKK